MAVPKLIGASCRAVSDRPRPARGWRVKTRLTPFARTPLAPGRVWYAPSRLPSYESRSPSNLVYEIDRPIFLAHGLDDPVVPAAAVRGLAQALRARGTPHVARFFDHEGHPPSRPETRAVLLHAQFDFCQTVSTR